MSGPLSGLRVLDAGNMIAGPMAATYLADCGAEVVKIEHPVHGDPLRDWEPKKDGLSLWWKVLNRNKRLVTLDLKQPRGRELFLELAAWADVVIENFRPGAFERWGLSYEELQQVNSGIILVRVSGYGQTGPSAGRPGYGTVAEALSGIPFFTGSPEGPPTLPGFPLADSVTAVFAAYGAMTAVYERDHGTGCGQVVDLSLFESLFRLVDSQVIGFDQLGKVKQRQGNRLEEDAPRNTYLTADGHWVAISASSNKTWQRLATAMDKPWLADDPRFATSSHRVENVEALDEVIQEWFSGMQMDDLMAALDTYDVVGGPVLDIAQIVEDAQYRARDAIVRVPDPDFGSVRMQAVVPKYSRTPGEVRHPGLESGHDNDDVYATMLGRSAQTLADLRQDKVI